VATATFRFDRSNSLQAIWPVAGQIVTALPEIAASLVSVSILFISRR